MDHMPPAKTAPVTDKVFECAHRRGIDVWISIGVPLESKVGYDILDWSVPAQACLLKGKVKGVCCYWL